MDSTFMASIVKRQSDGTKELLDLLQDPFSGQVSFIRNEPLCPRL
jgi:hypothetical protein